ncbi:hypothetical protein AgCh_022941 [Apium graveolens]
MNEDRSTIYLARFSPTTSTQPPQTSQPQPSEPTVQPSSSKPKRTKKVPQTQQKRRRFILRDESDAEEQVPVSEPIVKEAEKVSSQKDDDIGSSRPLKRLRKHNTDGTAPRVTLKAKRFKTLAKRPEDSGKGIEAAAKEGDQESLISQDPVEAHNSPMPQVLYLEALPTQVTPTTTPIPDADVNPELPTTPSLYLDTEDQILGEHQNMDVDQNLDGDQPLEDDVEASIVSHTVLLSDNAEAIDSVSSDAAHVDATGNAATNVDVDAAGPSGHAPQQTVHKTEIVKKFVTGETPVPWSETPRGQEWTKEWNIVTFVPSEKILAEHLAKADEMLINDDFKTQLRVTALSTRHLQGQHSITHDKVNKIQENLIQQDMNLKLENKRFFQPTFDRIAYIEKTQEKQQSQIDEILKNQASHQNQLNEIQSSVELLVSLLLPADAKKGEKVIKSKCKLDKTLKKKDDGNDPGNSGMGGGHGQGGGLPSSRAGTISHRTSSDIGRRITSDTGKRISSDELLELDEEISRQLFLKENLGMDFESLMEEEARLKIEKVNCKSEASVVKKKLPMAKGIVIKERINPVATKAKSHLQIDPRSKGKEKVGEPVKLLLPGFTKAKQTQPLKTAASGFEARVVTGKEARDKSGLDSVDERRVQNTTNDPTSLSEPDGRVYHIRENAIPLKYFEELEHVLFLLQVNDRITESATNCLKNQIQRQKRLYSVKSDNTYYPKYRDHKGDIVDMKPNTAKIRTYLGIKGLEFNLESDKAYVIRLDQELRKAKITDLRYAIFQTGEDTAELKDAKRRMIDELRYDERCLLKNYLRTTPDIEEIRKLKLLSEVKVGKALRTDPFVSNGKNNPSREATDIEMGIRLPPRTIHSPLALTEEEWDDTYTTNVKGALLMSKHVYILMRDSKQGGSVINISSIAGLNRGQLPGSLAYSSLKTALNALTKV